MREAPPPKLIGLLQRLGLATGGEVRRMGGRVHRLARDLPRFESVWVDALAQARILTPFQAAEINAGRGEALRIGPYVLCGPLSLPDYVACYRARRRDSRELVRLAAVDNAGKRSDEILSRLETLAAASKKLHSEQLAPVTEVGADGGRIWAAFPWIDGRTAAEWIVHNGRFPPEVVLEIARVMLAGLVALEKAGLCHGDVSTAGLVLTETGGLALLQPGVRAILRPEEGYAHAELLPEAYDYLAPERITDGTPPTIASDIYACGCVWWHLLCGRPPLSGGDSVAKLCAGQEAKVFDVRRLAPEVCGPLAAAVSACLEREPGRRPESMARLAAMLGSPSRRGKLALARCLAQPRRPGSRWASSFRATGRSNRAPLWLAATAACLVAGTAILWAIGRAGLPAPTEATRGEFSPEPIDAATIPAPQSLPEPIRPLHQASFPSAAAGGQHRSVDNSTVVTAAYNQPELQDLVLASGGPLEIESLPLRAGQHVRGVAGERPLVMVPRNGLAVDAENVCFENIDFLWDHPADLQGPTARQAAVVHLRAACAEFHGCSFQSTRPASTPPVAIRWTHPALPLAVDANPPPNGRSDSALSLPSGRVQLSDCVLRRVDAGVDCRTVGALALKLANTLHLGTGPLVRLDHCPKPDEPVLITLSQVTLRGTGPLLECCYGRIEGQPGEISIQASRSAFVPEPSTALILLSGPKSPGQMLRNMRWTGQGSLVSPEAVIAAWRGSDGRQQVLDDDAVSIAGLVRSEVGFAGNPEADPAASRIIRWQVPLRSTDPPGIDPETLPGTAPMADG